MNRPSVKSFLFRTIILDINLNLKILLLYGVLMDIFTVNMTFTLLMFLTKYPKYFELGYPQYKASIPFTVSFTTCDKKFRVGWLHVMKHEGRREHKAKGRYREWVRRKKEC